MVVAMVIGGTQAWSPQPPTLNMAGTNWNLAGPCQDTVASSPARTQSLATDSAGGGGKGLAK
eukprot:4821542-Heterocapsa_arctica.AAC.2